MCHLRFNCKRTIFFLGISLTAFFIGVGFSKIGQVFTRSDAEIVEISLKVKDIPEIRKAKKIEPRFKQMISCEQIESWKKYAIKARDKRYANGGVLNGRSCFVEPTYPKEAIKKSVSGEVKVEVLVDGLGIVRSAKAISGHQLLKRSAVEAAYKTQISPTMLGGEFVNIKGLLIYEFVLPEQINSKK